MMPTSYRQWRLRQLFHIILLYLALYIVIQSVVTLPRNLLEALILIVSLLTAYFWLKKVPKIDQRVIIITNKDKLLLDRFMYVYLACYLLQFFIQNTSFESFRLWIGIVLVIINGAMIVYMRRIQPN
jgi:hypothetical protein